MIFKQAWSNKDTCMQIQFPWTQIRELAIPIKELQGQSRYLEQNNNSLILHESMH